MANSPSDPDFAALFDAHYRTVCRAIYRVTGDTARSEELASEAFWRLHRKPPADRANLAGWLCCTGVRLALDALRDAKTRHRYESLAPLAPAPANPEDAMVREEERGRVHTVLAAMKPAQAELLVLRYGGLSYAELAGALQLSLNSIGTLLARAEDSFRKEYERRYGKQ